MIATLLALCLLCQQQPTADAPATPATPASSPSAAAKPARDVFLRGLDRMEATEFDTFLTEVPAGGRGLNPLLQNPYMATHPPSLYIGLVSCAVPFAFGMAALITGNLDDSWLRSVRRWVLLSWFFLTLGLTLGMLWAYEVLGWGPPVIAAAIK